MVDASQIDNAVRILRAGGLVAFPTETVYGLGADATNPAAVERIFAVKGRPTTNPIIVHVGNPIAAQRYSRNWTKEASRLAARFWPGPLTLVVKREPVIYNGVSAGRSTVGLRVPNHPVALALLEAFGGAVAAPSANRSTRISPTQAEHVREELGDQVDLILDGGPCEVGIESTVLDLSESTPRILRQGAIKQWQIEEQIGPVEIFAGSVDPSRAAASPGQHAVHYSPGTPAYRFESGQLDSLTAWINSARPNRAALLCFDTVGMRKHLREKRVGDTIQMPHDEIEYARQLYASLRAADRSNHDVILVEMPPDKPQWAAIRDRLNRATKRL